MMVSSIYEHSMIPEQMWNVIAHIKQQFGRICCGFGAFKQLKPVKQEHINFRNSWIDKYVFGKNLCELKHIHRFNESKVLQGAYKYDNGEHIGFYDYTKGEHDLCLCWANQAVKSLNQKWDAHYAKGKQIEVTGHKQPKVFYIIN